MPRLVSIAMICVLTSQAWAVSPADSILIRLAEARARYDVQVDRVVADVDRVLAKLGEGERSAFHERGVLPEYRSRDKWLEHHARRSGKMVDAYDAAIEACREAGMDELADSIGTESDAFSMHSDLVPWSSNLIAAFDESARRLKPDQKGLVVEWMPECPYRVEIVFSESCHAEIELPHVGGGRSVVAATPVGDPARSSMTVYTQLVAPDVGVARPIERPRHAEDGAGGILVRAVDAPAEVVSVRIKRILPAHVVVDQDAKARDKEQEEPRRRPPDLLPLGAVGHGEALLGRRARQTQPVEVTVVSRDGDAFALRVKVVRNTHTLRVEGVIRGNSLHVTRVEQTRKPTNLARFRVSATERGGGVIRNGVLSMEWTVRGNSQGAANNRTWTVKLYNVRF